MAAVRIEISEIVTGLGLFGCTDSRAALRSAMAGRCLRLPRLPRHCAMTGTLPTTTWLVTSRSTATTDSPIEATTSVDGERDQELQGPVLAAENPLAVPPVCHSVEHRMGLIG